MSKSKDKNPKRNPVVWGMQTKRSVKFRHRADRKPKDARRMRDWRDEA